MITKVEEMAAGPALNALVAEHIMGWKWYAYTFDEPERALIHPDPAKQMLRLGYIVPATMQEPPALHAFNDVDKFSTDAAADLSVHQQVWRAWDTKAQRRYVCALARLLSNRGFERDDPPAHFSGAWHDAGLRLTQFYQVGDYSRAAIDALPEPSR